MATIPRSRGPAVMPGRAVVPQASGAEAGMASARAMENFGQTGQQVALNIRGDQMREEQRVADEQRRQAEAANRAREMAHLGKTEDALRDAQDEILTGLQTGEVPKDQAESIWQERAKKITEDALPGFTDQSRPLVQGQIENMGARLGNGVRKAKTQRDRQDVTAGITTTLEYLQRQYQADPAGSTAKAMQTLEQLGPFSTLSAPERAKLAQSWKEGTQYTAAFEVVNAAKNSPKLLTIAEQALAGDKFADLDPQRRAVLVNQIDGHRVRLAQQAEIAAARAARQQEAALNRARAEFETFQAMADKGTVLAPEYIDRVTKATAGTPYQAGIKQVSQQIAAVGGLAAQSIATQQATLDAITGQIAKTGRTPELDARRAQVEKVLNGSRQDLQADPLRAGLERGVITELQPLNLSGGIPGVLQQITTRVQQANTVGQWAGAGVSPLTADEAASFGKMLGNTRPDDKANAIALMASQVPSAQLQALAKQLNEHDRGLYLAMTIGSTKTSAGTPAARLVLLGQEYLRSEGKKDNTLPAASRKTVSDLVGDMFTGQVREDIVDAATYVQLGKKMDGQDQTARKSVEAVIGSQIINHAGRQIPAPPLMSLSMFQDALPKAGAAAIAKLPDAKVHTTGGEVIPAADFLADLPLTELLPAGAGRYYVRAGSGVAMDAKGKKIILEVR